MKMLTIDDIQSVNKENLEEISAELEADDLNLLVSCLDEKDDKIRYPALLLLQHRSEIHEDVFPFWDEFTKKLTDTNSFQRSIGLMMIAANARWDHGDRMKTTLDDYLNCLNDEKPITIRQGIQGLMQIVPFHEKLRLKIADRLMQLDLKEIRETMRKSILTDILNVLMIIRRNGTTDSIEQYIGNALTGGILDRKTVQQFQHQL